MAGFSPTNALIAVLVFLVVVTIAHRAFIYPYRFKGRPLPGPSGYPVLGNIADLPPANAKEWTYWAKHKDLYGPISAVKVLGQTLVIINDRKAAIELMEKRSSTNSSRPHLVFAGDLCGYRDALAMIPYSPRSRAYRKAMHANIGSSSALAEFGALFELNIRRFLLNILEQPKEFRQLIRSQVGSVILQVGYGYTMEPHGRDPLVDLTEEMMDQFGRAAIPGAWLVDTLPFLRHLPDWMPGTSFKRTARHYDATLKTVADISYNFVEEGLQNGTARTSYLSKLLQNRPLSPDEDHIARWSAASLYGGGADTTVSSMACFFLAMILYPDVQHKAQAEIDSVIGNSRLPSLADRKRLPYVNAIVKEVLRWHPVAPMGLPHMSTQDDEYNGYHIPKGSILLPNIWAMLHDPDVYKDPETFAPERFLGSTPEPDSHDLVFGFGRRVCPGKAFADRTVFLSIADTLAAFDVKKVVKDGKEIDPLVSFTPGVISHPEPFRCDIKVRSEEHEKLIRSVEAEHPLPKQGDARYLNWGVAQRV